MFFPKLKWKKIVFGNYAQITGIIKVY